MESRQLRARLEELGHELPPAPGVSGNYQPWIVDGALFRTSGQVSRDGDRVIEGPRAQCRLTARLHRLCRGFR